MKSIYKSILMLTAFAVAMGFLETAVVVYLRALYYPKGFNFPMVVTSNLILKTELLRELATLIMLLTIGWLTGKNAAQRFVFFLYSFAIWDLFYYVFLKILLNWPASVFTWDILFLLPLPWYGPVLAPCLISTSMIALMFLVVYLQEKGFDVKFIRTDWLLMILASLIFIGSFTFEFLNWYLICNHPIHSMGFEFVPQHYNWWVFCLGEIVLLIDFWLLFKRGKKG